MPTSGSSRRRFLGVAAGALALPAIRFDMAAAAPPRSGGIKLGVASYSLRKFSLDQMLDMCRDMNVRYVTMKDFHMPRTDPPEATRAARQKIEAAGLIIMGGGVITMKKDEAQIRKDFEYARHGGFPLIVASPEPDSLDIVERMVKEFDIGVAIHNHGPEDKFYPAPKDALDRIKDRDERIGLCIDIGHTLRAGVDPVQAVHESGGRLLDLHLKDLASPTDRDSQVEVGKGVIDIPGLFRALMKVEFTGHAALEYEINADNPLVGMKESLAYMRGVLAALETT
jgi:sugar phosphate isomerase/epimerase